MNAISLLAADLQMALVSAYDFAKADHHHQERAPFRKDAQKIHKSNYMKAYHARKKAEKLAAAKASPKASPKAKGTMKAAPKAPPEAKGTMKASPKAKAMKAAPKASPSPKAKEDLLLQSAVDRQTRDRRLTARRPA